jgi:hypothetical protein
LQSKADLNRFMAGCAAPPPWTFEQIYANGWFHPLNDLFHALAAGPAKPDPAVYYAQRLAQIEFQRVLLNLYAAHRLDFLMYPDVQVLPPTYRELESDKWTCLTFPTNTVIASQSHLPALSMPAGFSSGRIPVGVEVVDKPYAEAAGAVGKASQAFCTQPSDRHRSRAGLGEGIANARGLRAALSWPSSWVVQLSAGPVNRAHYAVGWR